MLFIKPLRCSGSTSSRGHSSTCVSCCFRAASGRQLRESRSRRQRFVLSCPRERRTKSLWQNWSGRRDSNPRFGSLERDIPADQPNKRHERFFDTSLNFPYVIRFVYHGMASIKRRRGREIWTCWFRDENGRQHCRSTETVERKLALAIAEQFEAASQKNAPCASCYGSWGRCTGTGQRHRSNRVSVAHLLPNGCLAEGRKCKVH